MAPSVSIPGNPMKVNPNCSTLYSKFLFRLTPNQLVVYPNWILLYLLKIILPMLVMVAAASKILIKNGKELRREFFQAFLQTSTFPKQDTSSSLDYQLILSNHQFFVDMVFDFLFPKINCLITITCSFIQITDQCQIEKNQHWFLDLALIH